MVLPRFSLVFSFSLLALFLIHPADARRRKKDKSKPKTIYEIDTLKAPIPRSRQSLHVAYNKALRGADASDGRVDGYIWHGDDTLASAALTEAFVETARHLDTMIENLPFKDLQVENQTKSLYLRAVTNMVIGFNRDINPDPYFYRKVVFNMRDMIIARHEARLPAFVYGNANAQTLFNVEILADQPELKAYLYREVAKQDPQKIIGKLSEFVNEPYACEIIAQAARKAPKEVYKYASSTNGSLNSAVRRCNDPLVQTIVRISKESKSPLKAMSFVSDIYQKRLSIPEVDKITANEHTFFKNLVRLKLQGDTLGSTTFSDELEYRANRIYITRMNELHEASPAVRFKVLDGMSAEEIYFIIVYGQDQVYTSSFTGAFDRMMKRLGPTTGYELLQKVRFEHFRTFIRMCAGYNKLDAFMATMPPEERTRLLRQFASNLELGGADDLEDAVDVADAFGSIRDTLLAEFLRQEILSQYNRVSKTKNTKGIVVYELLTTLTKGSSADELSRSLQLPPINRIPNGDLLDDTRTVYEQFFFYGDEDGRSSYGSFMSNFHESSKWDVEKTAQWVTIKSTSGHPVVIYANLPLDHISGKDDVAQKALRRYLSAKDIHPTILVHRGHSYHLNSTIDNMERSNRIVILGSCGGYHNLGKVLERAPDAHLISTKQTGTTVINDAIIKRLNAHLLDGDDIDWPAFWRELSPVFKGKDRETFDDYVPPHRNLGAIFIKAYRRIYHQREEEE